MFRSKVFTQNYQEQEIILYTCSMFTQSQCTWELSKATCWKFLLHNQSLTSNGYRLQKRLLECVPVMSEQNQTRQHTFQVWKKCSAQHSRKQQQKGDLKRVEFPCNLYLLHLSSGPRTLTQLSHLPFTARVYYAAIWKTWDYGGEGRKHREQGWSWGVRKGIGKYGEMGGLEHATAHLGYYWKPTV